MEEAEREGLKDFLYGLESLLRYAVYDHPEWFPRDIQQPMESAWREVEPVFAQVARDIESREYDQQLEREGLVGEQLRFKLAGFAAAESEVEIPRRMRAVAGEDVERPEEEQAGPGKRSWLRRGGQLLGYFRVALDWGNAIVESIGKAIPAAGAIGEFKKGVEAANRLNEERQKPRLKRLLGL